MNYLIKSPNYLTALAVFCLAILNSCALKTHLPTITQGTGKQTPTFFDAGLRLGANFFNEVESKERMIAARKLGITWIRLTPSKWRSALYPNEPGSFLVGPRAKYQGLVQADLKKLLEVLDWAHEAELKVVLTFLDVPGRWWAQHANGKQELTLWESNDKQEQAVQFFADVATYIGGHQALAGINPINEPCPEHAKISLVDWRKEDYDSWQKKIEGSFQDLNVFNKKVVKAIRRSRRELPIILSSGFFAQPWAFHVLKPINDPMVFYSFHFYTPYRYTFQKGDFSYPGNLPVGETQETTRIEYWDRAHMNKFFQPVRDWQNQHKISSNRIIVGEYGVDRSAPGAAAYLRDAREIFTSHGWSYAFYSFREYNFAKMDYELGTQKRIYPYWQALEKGNPPNYRKLRKPELLKALNLKH